MADAPLDLGELHQQTGGDRNLARDVLELFVTHAPEDLAKLLRVSGYEREVLAHRLVGSARGVGAGEVARLAQSVERGADDDVPALEAAIGDAVRFVASYLAETAN